MKEEESKIKSLLKVCMPDMIAILGEQEISWSSIDKTFRAHLAKIRQEVESTGNRVEKDVTFHTLILGKITKQDGRADAMFEYFNLLFYSLRRNLNENERKLLHRMISNVLLKVNKDYLNFIGELAVLNHFMSSKQFELHNIEERIVSTSNASADILLKTKTDSKELLIEVLNIHLAGKEFTSYAELKSHLELKLVEKVQNKVLTKSRTILIQPVLWIKDESNYKFISDFYNTVNFNIENVLDPLVYCSNKYNDGEFEHRFESIKTIMRP